MRAKYLIGISGTSIALMTIALVLAMPLGMSQASVNDIGSIQGHVTILAVHPDGTSNYIQGDNVIQFDGKNEAAARLWDDPTGAPTGINCVALGTGGGTTPTSDAVNGVQTGTTTTNVCGDDGGLNSVTDTTPAAASTSAVTDIVAVFTIAAGDDGATINEVALEDDSGGNAMSRFILAGGGVTVSTGTVLTITYTMTIT